MPRRSTGIVISVAMMLVAHPAAARPQAYDLLCGETHYRIDLRTKQWCEGDCETPRRLHGIGPTTLTLMLFDHFSLTYDVRRKIMTNGFDLLGTEDREMSQCRVLKFSGFSLAGRRVPQGQ